jgi:hypothetical protein
MLSGRSVLLVEHNGFKAFLKSYLNSYAYGISPDILTYKKKKTHLEAGSLGPFFYLDNRSGHLGS